jgi:hypothetical protein
LARGEDRFTHYEVLLADAMAVSRRKREEALCGGLDRAGWLDCFESLELLESFESFESLDWLDWLDWLERPERADDRWPSSAAV